MGPLILGNPHVGLSAYFGYRKYLGPRVPAELALSRTDMEPTRGSIQTTTGAYMITNVILRSICGTIDHNYTRNMEP